MKGGALGGWVIGVALAACEVAPLPPVADTEPADAGPDREADAPDHEGSDATSHPGALALAEAWRLVPVAEDPYAVDRPAALAPCDPAGVLVEAGTFELDTARCDWASFEQPLRVELEAGARVEVVFWYGDSSPDTAPGEALAVLRLGPEALWEARVGLPATGAFLFDTVTVPEAHAAGERLLFHLHNHGANTWALGSVTLLP